MSDHHPRFDGIDHSRPELYVDLDPSFAGFGGLDPIASQVRAQTAEGSLGAIWRWVRDHLASDQHQSDYRWRTASEILDRGHYFGCAEHALVYGCLARACGIPIVWVKSLDVAWIRDFRRTHHFDGGKGHVYLEAFLSGAWQLVDATQDELYETYNPTDRLLPGRKGDRYAYDRAVILANWSCL